MRATGIVRKVDQLGRIVLPAEVRRILELDEGTPMEIFVEKDAVALRKYLPSCVFCGEAAGTENYKGKLICKKCKEELRNL